MIWSQHPPTPETVPVWDFLKATLEHGGTTATLYFLTLIAGGLGLRVMWKRNQELTDQMVGHAKELEVAKAAASEEYAARLANVEQANAARLVELEQAHADEVRRLASRVDELQEQRVTDTREVTEKVVAHIGHIDTTVEKLGTAVDVLIELSGRRRP